VEGIYRWITGEYSLGELKRQREIYQPLFIYCVSGGDEMAERINSSMSSDFLCEWRG
jgi:hypothetical protein